MRPRSSLALAGALLVTLVPGTAMATQSDVFLTDTVLTEEVLLGEALLEDALTDEIRTDNADAPDASTLVPQDGAVVDDVDHRLNETRDPS